MSPQGVVDYENVGIGSMIVGGGGDGYARLKNHGNSYQTHKFLYESFTGALPLKSRFDRIGCDIFALSSHCEIDTGN
ncbi:MAG: hypothetical protein ACI97A_001744 [Planctomycetota bacterium]